MSRFCGFDPCISISIYRATAKTITQNICLRKVVLYIMALIQCSYVHTFIYVYRIYKRSRLMRMRFVFNSSSIRILKTVPLHTGLLLPVPLPVVGATTSSCPMSRRLINMLSSCSPTDRGAIKPETLISIELGKNQNISPFT